MRDQDLLNTYEAADYLGLARQTLAKWRSTKEQQIPYLQRGGKVYYRRDDLDQFKTRYTKCFSGE